MCLLGNFNFPGIKWHDNAYMSSSSDELHFIKCMNDFSLRQHAFNVHRSRLDLVFSNFHSAFTNVYKTDVEFKSDHNLLSFEIRLRLPCSAVQSRRA